MPKEPMRPPLTPEQLKDPQKQKEMQNEGSANFWVNHPHADWSTNTNTYIFQPISQGGITINSKKLPDKSIEVTIEGPFGKSYSFNAPIPPCTPKGLMITITWKRPEVALSLNGRRAKTIEA